jgi:hypothetical protein
MAPFAFVLSPAFTAAVYQHAWQEGASEAANALEQTFRESRRDVGNLLAERAERALRTG